MLAKSVYICFSIFPIHVSLSNLYNFCVVAEEGDIKLSAPKKDKKEREMEQLSEALKDIWGPALVKGVSHEDSEAKTQIKRDV